MQIPAITPASPHLGPLRLAPPAASAASRPRHRLGARAASAPCSPAAISNLNDSQNTAASDSVQALATGQASDVTSVVTDVEKATLAMQLAVQVRNKAVDAYQEIMRMQI